MRTKRSHVDPHIKGRHGTSLVLPRREKKKLYQDGPSGRRKRGGGKLRIGPGAKRGGKCGRGQGKSHLQNTAGGPEIPREARKSVF